MRELADNRAFYGLLSRILLTCVVISIVLMLIAVGGGLLGGQGIPYQAPPFDQSVAAVLRLDVSGLLGLGILALFATPILTVVVSAVAFARQRDWFYALVSMVVLGILALGVVLAR